MLPALAKPPPKVKVVLARRPQLALRLLHHHLLPRRHLPATKIPADGARVVTGVTGVTTAIASESAGATAAGTAITTARAAAVPATASAAVPTPRRTPAARAVGGTHAWEATTSGLAGRRE